MDRNGSPGLKKPRGFTVSNAQRPNTSMRTDNNSFHRYDGQGLHQRLIEPSGSHDRNIPEWSNGAAFYA